MNSKRIISVKHLELFHEGGFGGQIYKADDLHGRNAYIIKCERYAQAINEYAAHSFIRAIGLPAPAVKLIRIEEAVLREYGITVPFDVFGGVEYVADAVPANGKSVYLDRTEAQMSIFSQLMIINQLLGDLDATVEIYQKDDALFLLDLGETVVGEEMVKMAITDEEPYVLAFQMVCKKAARIEKIETQIESGKTFCRFYMERSGTVNESLIREAVVTVLERISMMKMTEMRSCFLGLKEAYGEGLADGYRLYFNQLRGTCRLIRKYM